MASGIAARQRDGESDRFRGNRRPGVALTISESGGQRAFSVECRVNLHFGIFLTRI
jgi:hypothetical protein